MKVHWGWLPLVGFTCGFGSMIATMDTINLWSLHTSYDCQQDLALFNKSHQQALDLIQKDLADTRRSMQTSVAQLSTEIEQILHLATPTQKDRLDLERRLHHLEAVPHP